MQNRILSPELLAAIEKASKPNYDLEVPAEVARDGKGYARWTEHIKIEGALSETRTGDYGTDTTYRLKVKIVPFGNNGASPNVGKTYTIFMGVNYDLLYADTPAKQAAAVGTKGTIDTSLSFTRRAINRLRQLMVALGYDVATMGMSEEELVKLFPSADGPTGADPSPLVGISLLLGFSDGPGKNNKNFQGVDHILAAPAEA